MSVSKVRLSTICMTLVFIAACSTTQSEMRPTDIGMEQPPQSDTTAKRANDNGVMRHKLRDLVEYDTSRMTKLVNKELNMKENNDEAFLNNASDVLSQTVMVQPNFTEREAAIRELKGKLDQEDYLEVMRRAANNLLSIATTSPAPSDQAGALVALRNLVVEAKGMKRPELKATLQKIAAANLQISEAAKKYAGEPMESLTSPSIEAASALQSL